MSELAKATVRITGDIQDLEAALQLAHEEMEKSGKTLDEMGHTLMHKVTLPLVALGGFAVHEFGEQADAVTRLDAVLQAAGGVTGTTTAQIEELAKSLQDTTRFYDDNVIAAASLLATFHQVRNEVGAGNDIFDRAIKASAGLAATMGEDLQSAAVKLGRALEDPMNSLMLLRRAGIVFSEGERAQIKILQEHGQVLEAQRMILDKVESKTRGVAEAMAKTPFGHFVQMWNAIRDAVKPIGGILSEALVPLADVVKNAASAFKDLSPEVQRVVVIIATAAAAVGPILLAWASWLKLLAFVKTAMAVGMIPTIGLLVVALGALVAAGIAIVENWAWIKLQVVSLWTMLKDVFFTGIEFILAKVSQLGTLASKIPELAKAVVPGLGLVSDVMMAVGGAAQTMHDEVAGAHEKMLAEAGAQLSGLEADYQAVIDKMVEAAQQAKKTGDETSKPREPAWAAPLFQALDKLITDLASARDMEKVLGRQFDITGAMASAYQAAIQSLQQAHVGLDQTISAATLHMQGPAAKGFNTILALLKQLDPELDITKMSVRELVERFQQLSAHAPLVQLANDLQVAADKQSVLGREFDAIGAKAQAYGSAISALEGLHIGLDQALGAAAGQMTGPAAAGFNKILDLLKMLDPELDVTKLSVRELIQRFQQLTAEGVLQQLDQELKGISDQAAVLGVTFDAAGATAGAYHTVVSALLGLHIDLDRVLNKNGDTLRKFLEAMKQADAAQIVSDLNIALTNVAAGFGGAQEQASAYETAIRSMAAAHVTSIAMLDGSIHTLDELKQKYFELTMKATIGQFFQDEIGKMVDALFEGKQHFADFVRDMLFQLSMLILKMEILHLIGGIGGGSVGKFLGLPGFATGGFLPGNQVGIVGEKGPELVRAGRSGMTIAPISAARGTAGDSGHGERLTVPVTINVQAVDQRGVAGFFEDNQGAVAGAVMKAVQRSRLLRQGMG